MVGMSGAAAGAGEEAGAVTVTDAGACAGVGAGAEVAGAVATAGRCAGAVAWRVVGAVGAEASGASGRTGNPGWARSLGDWAGAFAGTCAGAGACSLTRLAITTSGVAGSFTATSGCCSHPLCIASRISPCAASTSSAIAAWRGHDRVRAAICRAGGTRVGGETAGLCVTVSWCALGCEAHGKGRESINVAFSSRSCQPCAMGEGEPHRTQPPSGLFGHGHPDHVGDRHQGQHQAQRAAPLCLGTLQGPRAQHHVQR